MSSSSADFLGRLFENNRTRWWDNLHSETRSRDGRISLESSLAQEPSDFPQYRTSERTLYFFSTSTRSSIDGRFHSLGVEEKYNPLDLEEHLIDGAIHRGIVWVLGNPQNLSPPKESVSLYLVKTASGAMSHAAVDLYFPIVRCLAKLGIHIVFVNDKTGDHWTLIGKAEPPPIPNWLAAIDSPREWNLSLDIQSERNERAVRCLQEDTDSLQQCGIQKRLPEFGKSGDYTEIELDGGLKAAVIDYGNEWRLIELGLLLRVCGYDAVKSIYNPAKHKNKQDRSKVLAAAGRGIERRVAEEMLSRFFVILDWGVPI